MEPCIKEGTTDVLDLQADPPGAVEAALEFMYRGEYKRCEGVRKTQINLSTLYSKSNTI